MTEITDFEKMLEEIGTSDSPKIEALKHQIETAKDFTYNCSSLGTHLIGFNEPKKVISRPMAGIYFNNSNLLFFDKESREQVIIPTIKNEVELENNVGYVLDFDNPTYFSIAFEPGKQLELEDIYRIRTNGMTTPNKAFLDPVSAISSESELTSLLFDAIKENEILSQLTYRLRPADMRLEMDTFHLATFFHNMGKMYCLEKSLFGKPNPTLTELNSENAMKFFKPFIKGLHFFATQTNND